MSTSKSEAGLSFQYYFSVTVRLGHFHTFLIRISAGLLCEGSQWDAAYHFFALHQMVVNISEIHCFPATAGQSQELH